LIAIASQLAKAGITVKVDVLEWGAYSKVLAANLRRLGADWQARYGHPLLLAETFVDPTRFRGTSYRAANWVCLGPTRGAGKRGNRYHRHGVPKLVFVYPLHPRARERLAAPAAPR